MAVLASFGVRSAHGVRLNTAHFLFGLPQSSSAAGSSVLWDNAIFHSSNSTLQPCASSPCQNGGTCSHSAPLHQHVCTCPKGYEGANCEHKYTDECQFVAYNSPSPPLPPSCPRPILSSFLVLCSSVSVCVGRPR